MSYDNTYCANIPGFYQCRCISGYSVGGKILIDSDTDKYI